MAKYVIHTCPERMWYVKDYLVPSLRDQGIKNIGVKCDYEHLGNLESCMKTFGSIISDRGTWHLQDDVVICRDFKDLTERYDYGIVAGYVFRFHNDMVGYVGPDCLWYSFPCIRIPDKIARECAAWFYDEGQKIDPKRVEERKYDDWFFREFLLRKYPDIGCLNLDPNLVDHVDYLLGGSTINDRGKIKTHAAYFRDQDLVDSLENRLKNRRR